MRFDWRFWLVNRVTISLGVIALIAALWNGYRVMNDDGVLIGRVVGPEAVRLPARPSPCGSGRSPPWWSRLAPKRRRTARSVSPITVSTRSSCRGSSPRRQFALYFRNQNRVIEEPLRLDAAQ